MKRCGGHLSVHVEDEVWLGVRVIVMPGVTIGRGAVVGAGAAVTKDVPSYTVVAGVPARIVGRRARTALSQEECRD